MEGERWKVERGRLEVEGDGKMFVHVSLHLLNSSAHFPSPNFLPVNFSFLFFPHSLFSFPHIFPLLYPPFLSLQTLGSLSSRGSTYVYDVPSRDQLLQEVTFINDTTNITAEFSLLQSEVSMCGGEKRAGRTKT